MTRDWESTTAAETVRHRCRFGVVLAASLLLAVGQPLLAGLLDEQGSFDVFFSLLIVAVLLIVFEERELRRTALALGLAAFLGVWVGHAAGGSVGRVCLVGAYLLAACFFAFALYGILRAIFVKQISGDAIFGAVCGYLLLGIIWSLFCYAVETASPGSFNITPPSGAGSRSAFSAAMRASWSRRGTFGSITRSSARC